MRDGDKVRIINPDNSFFDKEGIIISCQNTVFIKVFIKEKKEAYSFLRSDLKEINRRKEG